MVLRGQGLAGLLGQTEQPGGKRVGQISGVGAGQHGHAADVAGRVARRQIDQVGVPHAVVLKVALVVAADDQAVAVGQLDGLYVRGVIAPGILDTRGPGLAAGLCADSAHIAADVQQGAGQPAGLCGPGGLLHSVALAHRTDVERHLRVSKIDGLCCIVQNQIFYVDMRQRRRDDVRVGRGRGVAFPRVVPQAQHRTCGDVRRAVGGRVSGVFTPAQKCVQLVADLHRRSGGPGVDIIQVDDAIIVVVDVKQFVIAL